MRSSRLELLLGSAALLITAGPFLLGKGVDVPDDALHHSVANWEWLRYAWSEGLSPYFVYGKLGGISLASDVVPMGPYYPAAWLLFFLPVSVALPLVSFVHALGILLAVRWMARTFGVGSTAATLAGAAIAAGPLGAITFIDCHLDVLPIYLWLPVAFGATERFCRAEESADRLRWGLLCGAALALLLLGSHLRFSAAACAAWGLWALIRGMPLRWTLGVSILATCGGAPGFLPNLLALDAASNGLNRFVALSGPVHETFNGWNLAGWLAPKPYWMNRDFSVGAVLGIALLCGFPVLRGPLRRLAVFAAVLMLAALSPAIPGLRYLFAPLLILSHPLDLVYGALALLPAAVAAAAALEALCRGEGVRSLVPRSGWGRGVLGLLALAMVLRAAFPEASFADSSEWLAWLLGVLQAAVVLTALAFVLRSRGARPGGALAAVFLLALLDLGLLGVRYHLAVPAGSLDLRARAEATDLEDLGTSYLDITDLADLEGFLYDLEDMDDVSHESQARSARRVRADLTGRRWPLHVGPAHGIPALSGRAKMPGRRSVEVLAPLSEALVRRHEKRRIKLEQDDPEAVDQLFAPGAIGSRILRLSGTQVAVDRTRVVGRVDDPLPPCWIPGSYLVVEDGEKSALSAAWELGVIAGNDPLERAVLEAPISLVQQGRQAAVRCEGATIEVDATEPTLVVLLRPWLEGWSLTSGDSLSPDLFPADAFHLGFVAPPGQHRFELRFVPPGLCAAQLASGLGWLVILAGLLIPAFLAARRSEPS